MVVKKGNRVRVEYTGTLEDGTVFDSSEAHGKPLEFEAGMGLVIKGFDEGVLGMTVGEEKVVVAEPSEAYGDRDPQLVQRVPRDKLPPGELRKGMILGMTLPNGQQHPVVIADLNEREVSLDLNHPLAGKKLTFKIKLLSINGDGES